METAAGQRSGAASATKPAQHLINPDHMSAPAREAASTSPQGDNKALPRLSQGTARGGEREGHPEIREADVSCSVVKDAEVLESPRPESVVCNLLHHLIPKARYKDSATLKDETASSFLLNILKWLP